MFVCVGLGFFLVVFSFSPQSPLLSNSVYNSKTTAHMYSSWIHSLKVSVNSTNKILIEFLINIIVITLVAVLGVDV